MPSRTKPGTRYTGLLGSSFNPTDNKGRSSPTMTNRTGLAISSFFSQKDFVLNELSRRFCFDDEDCLEEAGCPVYKIASYELNDVKLIDYCAQKGKPMVMSTGLATEEEIDRAVAIVKSHGITDLTLLHCESR